MKNLSVVVAGTGTTKDISIKPGTKCSDITRDLGLTGYVLSKGTGDRPFNPNDDIYPLVNDGDKLFAATQADAGR